MTRHATDRCLIAELDSTRQRERWRDVTAARSDRHSRPAHLRWFSGILRATDLLSSQIVLTGPQVLDGAFFLALGPDRVRRILGREDGDDGGITVVTRRRPGSPRADLAESLRALVVDDGATTLRSFRFSGVERLGLDADRLQRAMAGHRADHVVDAPRAEVASVLAGELARAYADPGAADAFARLATEWSAWIAATDDGAVNLEMAEADAEVAAALAGAGSGLDDVLASRTVSADDARRIDLVRVEKNRSTAWAEIERIDDGSTRRLVKWWYDAAYAQAFADMTGSSWIAYEGMADAAHVRLGARQATVPITGRFCATLGDMPDATFTDVRYRARDAIAAWLDDSTARNHRALSYVVHLGSSRPRLAEVRTRALLLLVLFTLGIAFAVAGAVSGNDYVVVAVVLALLSGALGLPFDALIAWRAARSRRLDAMLFVARPDAR